jgi:alkylation response protein AidB-like acyl-CoA dehydrogenase
MDDLTRATVATVADRRTAGQVLRARVVNDLATLNFRDADERRHFPPTLFGVLARRGLFGLTAAKRHGGLGLPLTDACAIISATASFDISTASTLVIHNMLALPCIEQALHLPSHDTIMAAATRGDGLCAFAMTEPGAGSATKRIAASATRENGHYRLNGRKIWIGLGEWARWIVCFARSTQAARRGEFMGLLVDPSAPGFRITHEHRTLGLRGVVQNSLDFSDVLVPESAVLSLGQDGWSLAARRMSQARVGVASMGLGAMDRAIQIAVAYAQSRQLSKSRLMENSHVERAIAQMIMRRTLIRQLLQYVCENTTEFDADAPYLTSVLKVLSSEWSNRIVDQCLQFLGGRGYEEEMLVARMYRDARILRIFEGPTEALLAHLGRSFFSPATRDTVADLFSDLGAARTHAALRAAAPAAMSHGAALVHTGWLVSLALVSALARRAAVTDADELSLEAAAFAEDEFRTALAGEFPRWGSAECDRAKRMVDGFVAEAAATIRVPLFDADRLKIVGFA